MPANPPLITPAAANQLVALGQQIRTHRKAPRVSATAAAEAAGMSRCGLRLVKPVALTSDA